MADKQRRPRAAASSTAQSAATGLAGGDQDRRPVRPPMDNGIFALLRRGNQAMNERVAADRQQDASPSRARPAPSSRRATRAAAAPQVTFEDIWADIQDMVQHGDFTFRQLVAIIEQQPDLAGDERMRMKEQARVLYQGQRGDGAER